MGLAGRGDLPPPKLTLKLPQPKPPHRTMHEPDLQTLDLTWTSPKPAKDTTKYTVVRQRCEDTDMPQARSHKQTASIEPARNPYDHLDEDSETENDTDEEDNGTLLQTQDDTEIEELRAMLLTAAPSTFPSSTH